MILFHTVISSSAKSLFCLTAAVRRAPHPLVWRGILLGLALSLDWQTVLMENLDEEQFEALVVEGLDALADEIVEGLENVVFVTEARPEDGSLNVLGLYDGVALTERGQYGFGELPDRIILFREPLVAICETLDELREQIHVTLVHEIAHYYGIDDEQLHELGWA
ncbi:hypothetical protein GCM10009655_13790 [Rhodoglobus aureus]|uniref:Metallopeptidase family protein n=2 Tax=Rhodoglobus aureus TaxID=191497 RepID=A0ABN1VLM5_9MICO